MIKVFVNNFRLIMAEDNMILVDKETGIGSLLLFLGKHDSEENYNEISIDEYVEPEIEIEYEEPENK
jgi:hypothetical protein